MTNTADLTAFAEWLQMRGHLSNTSILVPDLVAGFLVDRSEDEEPEVPTVRHTSCGICELDVEVALDDVGMLTTDRAGSARCPGGTAHDPLLDPADWDAHDWHMGDVAH